MAAAQDTAYQWLVDTVFIQIEATPQLVVTLVM